MDHRKERLAEALREELSELIGYEMEDPRVTGAVVTDLHLSPDKRHVLLRVGVHGEADIQAVLLALESAKNFLRQELSKRLDIYRVPELHFEADHLAASGDRMEHLLKRIEKGRPRDAASIPEKKAVE